MLSTVVHGRKSEVMETQARGNLLPGAASVAQMTSNRVTGFAMGVECAHADAYGMHSSYAVDDGGSIATDLCDATQSPGLGGRRLNIPCCKQSACLPVKTL